MYRMRDAAVNLESPRGLWDPLAWYLSLEERESLVK